MFFVLSTGRAGSRTMANVLSQSPDLICTHEPVPRLVEETVRWRYGELPTEEYAEMLRESRPATIDGRRYGEAANRLSLGVPVLADVFEDSQFVWLVRDGRKVVSSGHQRGWFDHAADTVWERARLRGDRLGEVDPDEWASWAPFEKVCWLWTRTNEIIRDDLSKLPDERSTLLRLEDLPDALDDVADFLDAAAPPAWSIPRLNARGAGHVDESNANRVEHRFEVETWTTDQHEIFDRVCGAMMDDLYPGWREPEAPSPDDGERPPVVEATSQSDDSAAWADVRSLRAEISLLVDHTHRVDRRLRDADRRLADATAELERRQRAIDRKEKELGAERAERVRAEEAHRAAQEQVDAMQASGLEVVAGFEQRIAALEAEVEKVRASTSFRLGHATVRAVRLPQRALRAARRAVRVRLDRVRPRSIAGRVVRRAASAPGLVRVGQRLPEPLRARLHAAVTDATASAPASRLVQPEARSSKAGRRTGDAPPPVRLGLRAVAGPGLDRAAWTAGLDVVEPEELADQANVDLFLTAGVTSEDLHQAAAAWPDAVTVDVSGRVPPLPAGLTPRGFDRSHGADFLVLTPGPDDPGALLPPGRRPALVDPSSLPDPLSDPGGFARFARDHVAVVDSGQRASLDRVTTLIRLNAVGLPVAVTDDTKFRDLVPSPLLDAWRSVSPARLTIEHEREWFSYRQRTLVHDLYGPRAAFDGLLVEHGRPGLPAPSVSVVVASNRASMVRHWALQLAAQDHPDFEVIAALHGPAFPADVEAELAELLGDRITVMRIDERHTLGDALNSASAAAGGDLLVKWDDDDFYDVAHLRDLVRAKEYSRATLVGKSAEFAFLAGPRRTVRRLKTSTEAFSPTICGATLTIARADLRELGGWRRSRRRVDSMLIEDVRAAGGTTYRTSGFGFVMMRAGATGHGHTWTADDDYFLAGAIDQRPGLDLEFCGVRTPTEVAEPWS